VKRSGVLQSSRIDDRAPSECRNREEPLRALRRSLWPVSFATQAATRNCPAPKCRCPLCMWGVTASSNSLRRTSFEAEVNVRLTHGAEAMRDSIFHRRGDSQSGKVAFGRSCGAVTFAHYPDKRYELEAAGWTCKPALNLCASACFLTILRGHRVGA
jgi:hypothetical protein